jgi:hypothetical protein
MRLVWRAVASDAGNGELDVPEEDGAWLRDVSCADMMRLLLGRHFASGDPDVDETAAHVAAFHLDQLRNFAGSPVLLVCTPEWVMPVMQAMKTPPDAIPLRRLRHGEIQVFRADSEMAAVAAFLECDAGELFFDCAQHVC